MYPRAVVTDRREMSEFEKRVAAVPEGVLLGMGNPLLDISAEVPQEVLDR